MLLACHSLVFGAFDRQVALEQIACAGFGQVELAAIEGMATHVSGALTDAGARRVRRQAEAAGLLVGALDAATHVRDRVEPLLPVAAALEAPAVVVTSGGRAGSAGSLAVAVDHLSALAGLAASHGVRLALKPHGGAAVHDTRTALQALAAIPTLRLCLDTSHLYRAGDDPAGAARRLASHVVTCRARDCASRQAHPGPPEAQVPGRGRAGVAEALEALRGAGYGGPVAVELVGHIRRGRPDQAYPLSRLAALAAEARGYLARCLAAGGAS